MAQDRLLSHIQEHGLPVEFIDTVNSWYRPLAADIASRHQGQTLIVGVQGSQGSGKSTLASFLRKILGEEFKLNTIELSIDDFYLGRQQRLELAETIHPLLATRGVPGTHDIPLALRTLDSLSEQNASGTCRVPRFNKATDDRCPASEWETVSGKLDVIILEGWCVGAQAEDNDSLQQAINELENNEDPHCIWRHYINKALQNEYQTLFARIDCLAVLMAPSFECVFEWRWLQEQKLIERTSQDPSLSNNYLLDEAGVKRFISHYERLTRHCLTSLPQKADWVLKLNTQHEITALFKPQETPNTIQTDHLASARYLVSTDLDGTLLDHFSYSWQAATESIQSLMALSIPIIINTSKTFAEVNQLQNKIALNAPFIVENGSAIYIPKGLFSSAAVESYNTEFDRVVAGSDRQKITRYLTALRDEHGFLFEGYNDWQTGDIIKHTGLSEASAKQSQQRQFSEPIIWHDSQARFDEFSALISLGGLRIIKGGRFIHILGCSDKGSALNQLMQLYHFPQSPQLICLGDSDNDLDMLNIADIPVFVRSPTHDFPHYSGIQTPIYTNACGPEGWHEAMSQILSN